MSMAEALQVGQKTSKNRRTSPRGSPGCGTTTFGREACMEQRVHGLDHRCGMGRRVR